jgi:acetyl-CoA acetyltransferase family protein
MQTRSAVIVDVLRTPMGRGKAGGALSEVHPVDLLATLLTACVERGSFDPTLIEDVMIGCVSQAAEQAVTPGRGAVLAAGFPVTVPATTIDRRCGSSLQALQFAAHTIMAGGADIVVAGGVESMSRVPMGSARMGADPYGPKVAQRYPTGQVPQGISAELVAARFRLSRSDLDSYAAASHRRAAAAVEAGLFQQEICPVPTPQGLVSRDETIRPQTTTETLAKLNPSFVGNPAAAAFPEIDWCITPGNASQFTDGAAIVLVMSEEAATRLNLRARARFVAFDVVGSDPIEMLTGPMESTRRALRKAGLSTDDIAHFEVNEAFACVPLAWQRELQVDPQRLNPHGGAIALGHPLGASGARLITTMLHALERTGGRYGLASMCEAGGMANTTIIERL